MQRQLPRPRPRRARHAALATLDFLTRAVGLPAAAATPGEGHRFGAGGNRVPRTERVRCGAHAEPRAPARPDPLDPRTPGDRPAARPAPAARAHGASGDADAGRARPRLPPAF